MLLFLVFALRIDEGSVKGDSRDVFAPDQVDFPLQLFTQGGELASLSEQILKASIIPVFSPPAPDPALHTVVAEVAFFSLPKSLLLLGELMGVTRSLREVAIERSF